MKINEDVKEKCTETEKNKGFIFCYLVVVVEIYKTNIKWNHKSPFHSLCQYGKYILVERKRLDRYTDRLQLLGDTLRGEPFHYARHILRMHSQKYKQPASSAVSNNQSKQAKQHLHAG